MKTAMQELIELIVKNKTRLDIIEKNQQMWLEKEKEQIIEFCCECLKGDNIHTITTNKELIEYINNRYNQTYNQNK
jgi:hypothetical protein